mgnify:CR=1 FL=1
MLTEVEEHRHVVHNVAAFMSRSAGGMASASAGLDAITSDGIGMVDLDQRGPGEKTGLLSPGANNSDDDEEGGGGGGGAGVRRNQVGGLDSSPPMSPMAGSHLSYTCGIVDADKQHALHRVLFRVFRGNLFVNFMPIEAPARSRSGRAAHNSSSKNSGGGGGGGASDSTTEPGGGLVAFLIFYTGNFAQGKLGNICRAFGARCYSYFEEPGRRSDEMSKMNLRITELDNLLDQTDRFIADTLRGMCVPSVAYGMHAAQEKDLLHGLNMVRYTRGKPICTGTQHLSSPSSSSVSLFALNSLSAFNSLFALN